MLTNIYGFSFPKNYEENYKKIICFMPRTVFQDRWIAARWSHEQENVKIHKNYNWAQDPLQFLLQDRHLAIYDICFFI